MSNYRQARTVILREAYRRRTKAEPSFGVEGADGSISGNYQSYMWAEWWDHARASEEAATHALHFFAKSRTLEEVDKALTMSKEASKYWQGRNLIHWVFWREVTRHLRNGRRDIRAVEGDR